MAVPYALETHALATKVYKLARGGIDDVKYYVTMEMDKAMDIIDLNRTYNPSISKGTMDIYMEKL